MSPVKAGVIGSSVLLGLLLILVLVWSRVVLVNAIEQPAALVSCGTAPPNSHDGREDSSTTMIEAFDLYAVECETSIKVALNRMLLENSVGCKSWSQFKKWKISNQTSYFYPSPSLNVLNHANYGVLRSPWEEEPTTQSLRSCTLIVSESSALRSCTLIISDPHDPGSSTNRTFGPTSAYTVSGEGEVRIVIIPDLHFNNILLV